MAKRKIAIAIPTRDLCNVEMAHSLALLVGQITDKYVSKGAMDLCFVTCAGTLLPQMRNTLVEEAIRLEATHVLWIDSDMRFPADGLERLLKHEAPVVGTNYPQRKTPVKPTACNLSGKWIYPENQTGLEEVKFLGHGFCLVETAVYEAMSKPWYMLGWSEAKQTCVGEDVFFLAKVRKELGCPVLLDHDLSREITHIGTHEYTWADAFDDFPMVKAQSEEVQSAA